MGAAIITTMRFWYICCIDQSGWRHCHGITSDIVCVKLNGQLVQPDEQGRCHSPVWGCLRAFRERRVLSATSHHGGGCRRDGQSRYTRCLHCACPTATVGGLLILGYSYWAGNSIALNLNQMWSYRYHLSNKLFCFACDPQTEDDKWEVILPSFSLPVYHIASSSIAYIFSLHQVGI